jgi:hypothetical protein
MKILFCVTNFGFLRNFQSTIASLAERGHRIHLVTDRADTTGGMRMVADLTAAHPRITYEISAPLRRRLWYAFTSVVRLTLDYWRYLEPRFANAVQLRARAERQVPRLSVWLVHLPVCRSAGGRRALTKALRAVERVIPVRGEVDSLLREQSPDVLLVTPLLYFGSRQVEHIRAARRMGIPTILGVGSWDHLTTKGLIHEIPDYVAVWNELQKAEATELHGVPPERVVVTGAQAYDHWFDRRPSTSREAFCSRVGLESDRPYLLYLCSSPFITPHEVPFVRRWIAAVRGSASDSVRRVGILIRPHPQNAEQWVDVDLSAYENIAIWPRAGANPIDASAKADYFDSMFHSHSVVGVNTSALIESGIVGRRVYSILADEFSATQDGTLHFQHLKNVEGGLLRLASTLDEHTAQLAETLESLVAPEEDRKVRGFVQAFVRPHGLEVAATPRLVEAIERVGAAGRRPPQSERVWALAGRVIVAPVALAVMMASIERDRWWSWMLHVTRPPRLVLREINRWVSGWFRSVRRQLRIVWHGGKRRISHRSRGARRLPRRVWKGSLAVARRILGAANVE